MQYIPVRYIEPVFRPPSEANSLILQVTNGCSWNKCTYCDMYTQPQKRFSVKPEEDVLREIEWFSQRYSGIKRVFLADGDVIALPARRLLFILDTIRQYLPEVTRISSYCSPRNVTRKSDEELKALYDAGLRQVYVGAESGDDFVLKSINKGETHQSTVDSLNRLADAGIKRSVMIINGVGGTRFSEQHALNSALLANRTQPEFLAALVLNLPHGEARFQQGYNGQFIKMNQHERFLEMRQFVNALELKSTIFRSDHASNQLVLKGTLGKDKERLLQEIDLAIEHPDEAQLRPEWIRPF
ncbi:B12-binding domain-containing radical SAM protein [Oxalobacter aliiformigenes]|uniref:B12-binding domain-containing radical SAM protein n=1 Tax=Oxalobacter aliiformigenes TaxID=2946593 RepID=A0ABY7JIU9_9BURK|nr:radical SAM protein [Oxalobacter aliiformigenes]WAV89736.1 B12-binding domain-containing radical SAM protein [Oxalobacter aliiformigenes]WAV93844.1 B12-binding domain-containing radical SAM protein [Oxalobacter aliiformigenes]WAV94655.1 B12-binding domain-containing radical SAM protein [Oxalobacter aliiformigenes]WAV97538.1 B12-binding domain-containing radical SAM protein [Oxalobacter aliiformigenes]